MYYLDFARQTIPFISSVTETIETSHHPTPEFIPPDKKVESITTSAYLALLGMKAYGEGVKLQVKENTIQFNLAGITQGLIRSSNNASNQDFRTYQILTVAIEYPQSWYKLNSDEAKLILRIQKRAKLGLEYLKTTYENKGYLPDYIKTYLKKCGEFETAVINAPDLPEEQFIEPELDISILMRACWPREKYERLIELLDTAYKEFKNTGKPSEKSIAATTKFLTDQVEEFKKIFYKDYNKRYGFGAEADGEP